MANTLLAMHDGTFAVNYLLLEHSRMLFQACACNAEDVGILICVTAACRVPQRQYLWLPEACWRGPTQQTEPLH